MKILLLTAGYPPDPNVGSLRVRKVAEALRDAGHEVVVITARLPGETGAIRSEAPGLSVLTVRAIPNPRHGYLWLRDRIPFLRNRRPPADAAAGLSGPRQELQVPGWRQVLLSLLHLPDDEQGFILPALLRARRVARDADVVYTTTPPHSTHLAGLLLQRWFGIRWIAEFRDPWFARAPSRRVRGLEKALRNWCLRSADDIVAVTENTRAWLMRHTADAAAPTAIILARNGIDHIADADPVRTPSAPLRITHVGTFYLERDPRPFLVALANLRRRLDLGATDLVLDLVGWCNSFRDVSIERFAEDLGIADLIHFHGRVPHARALEFVERADLLLLLAQQQPLQVPNKLYEYLGTRKPILAFVDADGESATMLRQAGSHYLLTTDDVATIERTLEQAYDDLRAGRSPEVNERVLNEWRTERQMQLLLRGLGLAETGARVQIGLDVAAGAA